MTGKSYQFETKLWLYEGPDPWHFVTVPKETSDEIKTFTAGMPRAGFGSLPVNVTIGKTKWKTSIFPDKKAGAFMLPVKASVRKDESLKAGDTIPMSIELLI